MEPKKQYDVIVFDRATKKVVAILGRAMEPQSAKRTFSHAEKTLPPHYDLDTVEADTFDKGDVYK